MLWEELFTSKISSGHSSKDLNSGVGSAAAGSCSQKSWQKVIYILVGARFFDTQLRTVDGFPVATQHCL